MINTPLRTKKLLQDAEKLQKDGFYAPAILLYSHYLEQNLLLSYLNYLENKEPSKTKTAMDALFKIKDEGKLTFGEILKLVEPSLKRVGDVKNICSEVKKVRNVLGAHFFFVVTIDRTNRTKRAFDDVNNYRKFIRRLYSLIRKQMRMNKVESFLKYGSPLGKIRSVEQEAFSLEQELLKVICKQTEDNVKKAVLKLQPLGRFL